MLAARQRPPNGRCLRVLQRIERRDDDAHPAKGPETDRIAEDGHSGLGRILCRKVPCSKNKCTIGVRRTISPSMAGNMMKMIMRNPKPSVVLEFLQCPAGRLGRERRQDGHGQRDTEDAQWKLNQPHAVKEIRRRSGDNKRPESC